MADTCDFDAARAHAQHRNLHRLLARQLPVVCFAGDPATPDAVFPNNVFGTAAGRLVVGRMRHGIRAREAARTDIRGFFTGLMGYEIIDLSTQAHPCELTGAMVIDRPRGLGFCGLSDRCDLAGAALMHDAFGLRATLTFALAPGEYHTNVLLAVLAGRAVVLSEEGFAHPPTARAIASLYAPHAVFLGRREHAAFAANAIALEPGSVWMSGKANDALLPATRTALETAGFAILAVPLEAIEAAGGSLRCCVAEIY